MPEFNPLIPIENTEQLVQLCRQAAEYPYVTIDTEFLQDHRYYAQLCLIQIAFPGHENNAVLVDPLADALHLDPFYDLLMDKNVTKVFHAGHHDIQLFYDARGIIPAPVFDSQIAAMVCGFPAGASYESLVNTIVGVSLNKSVRISNWAERPLSQTQKEYALSDVTHLRTIYNYLKHEIVRLARSDWIANDLAWLIDPKQYERLAERAWRSFRLQGQSQSVVALIKALAVYREQFAQRKNIAKNRLCRDEAIQELAALRPQSLLDLKKTRFLPHRAQGGEFAEGVLLTVAQTLAQIRFEKQHEAAKNNPTNAAPPLVKNKTKTNAALLDLLKVLLKAKAQEHNVAPVLIAKTADLEHIAAGDYSGRVFSEWRYDVFGHDALRLCQGQIALSCTDNAIQIIPVANKTA